MVWLDGSRPSNSSAGDFASSAPGPSRNTSKVRVLLADDHAMLRQGLRSILRSVWRYRYRWRGRRRLQAIEQARSLEPHVVVRDVNMPGMEGIEATRRMRQELPAVAVVGLSVNNSPEVEMMMRDAGAALF